MYSHPKVRYTDPYAEKKNSIIRYIGNRVLNSNKNFLCAVTGQTGSGKSWASVSMSEIYQQMFGITFDVKEHVFFSLEDFLEIINNPDKIKTGTPLVFDESQIDINARAWQSQANQIMSSLISTFRNKRLVVFFPTPKLEFLDRQTRLLFHAQFEIQGFDKNTGMTKINPRFLTDFNTKKDEFYKKRLIVEYRNPDKQVYSKYYVQNWEIPKPSKEAITIYEGKKKFFTDKLNAELLERIKKQNNKANNNGKEIVNQDFIKFTQLFKEHGEDYLLFTNELPHVGTYTLEKWAKMLKRKNKYSHMATQ